MTDLKEAAVDYYHELLNQPATQERASDELRQRLEAARLTFGDRVLSPYLRPNFIDRASFESMQRICQRLWGSIQKVGKLALEDRQLQDYLGLSELERELIARDPMRGEVSPLSRLDSFLTDSYQFVELNAETPAGVAYSDVASEIYYDLEIMKEFRKRYRVSKLQGMGKLAEVLLDEYSQFSGKSTTPQVAIIDYDGPTKREFELVRDHLNKLGYKTIIADPRDLEYTSGRLHKDGFRIDLVYKRLLLNELKGRMDDCQELLAAYEAEAVCMVNCFRGNVLHKKALFGILTDEQFADKFSREELELITSHIPWTRRLEQRQTTVDSKLVDLISYVRKNKEKLVLKPNEGYGGKGISIGWQLTQSEWEQAIGVALKSDYLVQEKVETAHEVFPLIAQDGSITFSKQLVDLDPFLYKGVVGDAVTRLSHTELANVTSGGGMVPVFILEEKL